MEKSRTQSTRPTTSKRPSSVSISRVGHLRPVSSDVVIPRATPWLASARCRSATSRSRTASGIAPAGEVPVAFAHRVLGTLRGVSVASDEKQANVALRIGHQCAQRLGPRAGPLLQRILGLYEGLLIELPLALKQRLRQQSWADSGDAVNLSDVPSTLKVVAERVRQAELRLQEQQLAAQRVQQDIDALNKPLDTREWLSSDDSIARTQLLDEVFRRKAQVERSSFDELVSVVEVAKDEKSKWKASMQHEKVISWLQEANDQLQEEIAQLRKQNDILELDKAYLEKILAGKDLTS